MKTYKEHDRIMEAINVDFSLECEDRDRIRDRLMKKAAANQNGSAITTQEHGKRFHIKPAVLLAAALALTVSLSMLAYGENIVKYIKEFSVGAYAKYYVRDLEPITSSLPAELQGRLYDAEGNMLYAFPEDINDMVFYNENGEQVTPVYDAASASVILMTTEELENRPPVIEPDKPQYTEFKNIDDVKSYLAFDFLMPDAYPEGYSFSRARLYNGDDGQIPSQQENKTFKYFLTNADESMEISVMVTLMDETTAYEKYSVNMDEVTVNGYKGAMSDKSLDVEMDGIMYSFECFESDMTSEELLVMAESMK